MLSICDRALDSRDKKREEQLSKGESPEDETLGELTSHFDPPQCREGDRTTTLRWFVVGADVARRRRLCLTWSGYTPGQTQTGLGPRVYPFTTPDCCTA